MRRDFFEVGTIRQTNWDKTVGARRVNVMRPFQNHWGAEGERDENLQNNWGSESERDETMTTTTDHIIYFGIQAQAEGYVAERTSTRRVKDPNDGDADEAPYSDDLTQGGEVLPTVRREQGDYNYKKQNNCNCTTTGASKGKSSRSKHADNQHFRIGGDC